MIGAGAAVGANVLGNMVAAPLLPKPQPLGPLPAGVTAGDATRWQDYGWQSSQTPGPQVTPLGTVVGPKRPPVEPARGEPVPVPQAAPRELQPNGQRQGEGKVYDQTVILPTEPERDSSDKQPTATPPKPPVHDSSAMNQSMIIGAVAGALVAKSQGYHVLLGAGAGALVGHFYASNGEKPQSESIQKPDRIEGGIFGGYK